MLEFLKMLNQSSAKQLNKSPASTDELVDLIGGNSLYDGAYFILNRLMSSKCTELCLLLAPNFKGYITAIGHDWLGNIYAADTSRMMDGHPLILYFDVNSQEVLNTQQNLIEFHGNTLTSQGEGVLRLGEYDKWTESGLPLKDASRCIGYTIPLALGGSTELDNMEEVDIEVYWELTGQIGAP
ncbi:hypothetical protein DAETH_22330 [Deinococcus aetherius]|uniref:T6SS immunity protein Tdi1 C-terminal domain-containing protein n=1 Tax=Deinococcus aetherius TaxID=200252 RepID=A0ABM8AEQ1_9DEIO|nr:DUF1851 domain-containing protein [Deinococcus aetherius]BDP42264.1 hypothetical protein DAETH_22330 [Deinococcus aetherius]